MQLNQNEKQQNVVLIHIHFTKCMQGLIFLYFLMK